MRNAILTYSLWWKVPTEQNSSQRKGRATHPIPFFKALLDFNYLHNYLGVSQREPKFKIAQNRRLGLKTHASLLVVSAHAHIRTSAHGKKWLSQASSFEGSTNTMTSSTLEPHTNAHTVYRATAVDPHYVFDLSWSLRSDPFRVAPQTSREINLRANISEWNYREPCQMSYPMLIMQRTSFTGIDYRRFRCVCEPSRIPIRTLKWLRNKNRERLENLFIKHDVSSMDESAIAEEL